MRSKTLKEKIYSIYIDMRLKEKRLKEKIYSIYIDMNKRDLQKLTKAQLIKLLLKQEKDRQAEKPSNSAKQMVNDYEDNLTTRTIQRCIQANSSSSDQNQKIRT